MAETNGEVVKIWLKTVTPKQLAEAKVGDWLEGYGSIMSLAQERLVRKFGLLFQSRLEQADKEIELLKQCDDIFYFRGKKMTSFKLKKDGKTVGYAQILPCLDGGFHLYVSTDLSAKAYRWRLSTKKYIEADSIHPFVCKDKNKKDVFAGDKNIKHDLYFDGPGEIIWDKQDLQWKVFFPLTNHKAHIRLDEQLEKAENIELIEKKK